jgi:surface protein
MERLLFFVSLWNTSHAGTTNSSALQLPLTPTGSYNFSVNWGDGASNPVTSWTQSVHAYPAPGVYAVNISGTIVGFAFGSGRSDALKLLDISRFGPLALDNSGYTFYGCMHMTISAPDAPTLTGVTTLAYAFSFASSFNQPIGSWNTSAVTTMRSMFLGASSFDQLLGSWDVRNVADMSFMFNAASSFSTAAYNDVLTGWWSTRGTALARSVPFDATATSYSCAPSPAAYSRGNLTRVNLWSIIDGGCIPASVPPPPPVHTPASEHEWIIAGVVLLAGVIITLVVVVVIKARAPAVPVVEEPLLAE